MKLRLANLEYLIDINDLHDELGYVAGRRRRGPDRRDDPAPRAAGVAPSWPRSFPIFADAERVIADPVVRNRGTIGGSLCQADPSEDLSAVCTTLDASCVIRGQRRASGWCPWRSSTAARTRPRSATAEMLTEIRIPVRPGGSQRLREGRAPGR